MDRLLTAVPRADFGAWLEDVTPTWHWRWRHLVHVRKYLAEVTAGRLKRLMVFMPPRHGKSEMVTVRYPVYRLQHDPTMRVIVGAYNQEFANKYSRKARKIARGRLELSQERTAVSDWETTRGGGYRAIGVGSGITGHGGDLILIDDPVKSREEAESRTYRDRVWDWYTDDLYTRAEPGAAIVLQMTRWHDDDLAGRILASDDAPNWTVVSLPAEAEAGDPLGRAVGEALCPERYDEEALARIKVVLGRSYYALFQQAPRPRSGGLFKREWFEDCIVERPPIETQWVRAWDRAATEGGGDYTAGVLMGQARGKYYVGDVVRGQWETTKRDSIIRATAQADGPSVAVEGEQEPGSAGKDQARAFVRLLAGYTAHTQTATGDKETRAEPFASQFGAGNVRLVRGDWIRAFVDELCEFPTGQHDDQVDAAAMAFNKLARGAPLELALTALSDGLTQANPWSIE